MTTPLEAELRTALERARAELGLDPAEQVLDRWWRIAAIRANPSGLEEQAQRARPDRVGVSRP